jgi:hypothetical protein
MLLAPPAPPPSSSSPSHPHREDDGRGWEEGASASIFGNS